MFMQLPFSVGEALDRLTILEIKKNKIKDERVKDVLVEYDMLYQMLEEYFKKNEYYYNMMYQFNLKIWDIQDLVRDKRETLTELEHGKLCMSILDLNDARFRAKKKINENVNSTLKEQKGYAKKKALSLHHLGLGDQIVMIPFIRMISFFFDEVLVYCKKRDENNIRSFYSDDSSIKIAVIENDNEISPRYGCSVEKFKEITNGYQVFLSGFHDPNCSDTTNFPECFYNQLGLDYETCLSYFHVPDSDALTCNRKFIFIHDSSSNLKVQLAQESVEQMKKDYLLINPCNNMYQPNEEDYDEAQKYVGHPILSYKKLIEEADKLILTDSCFWCFSMILKPKAVEKICCHRYDYTEHASKKHGFFVKKLQ